MYSLINNRFRNTISNYLNNKPDNEMKIHAPEFSTRIIPFIGVKLREIHQPIDLFSNGRKRRRNKILQ